MAEFNDHIAQHILRWEGGVANDPDDPGGLTNKGITIGTFEKYAMEVLGVQPTRQNLLNLTDAQALRIYRAKFWDSITGDKIDSQDVAHIYLDMRINAGTNAVKIMQRVLNQMGQNLVVDGLHGSKTLAAINSVDAKLLHDNYKEAREAYYRYISDVNPKLRKFLNGWLARVRSFPWLKKK